MLFAVTYSGVSLISGNPLPAIGAVAGGLQGGIEASMTGGDFGDVMLTAGLGAAFGAIVPSSGIGSLAGSLAFAGTAWALGKDKDAIASAWQWGGLVGGIAGDFTGGALSVAKFGLRRALTNGLIHAGPDLYGAGAGAIIGYSLDGTSTGALHGAMLGMMAGGLWGANRTRSLELDDEILHEIQKVGYPTPTAGIFESWRLWWKHYGTIRQLKEGDVLLESVNSSAHRNVVFHLLGELTSGSGREIALIRTQKGRVLRLGRAGGGEVNVKGAQRIIAHTHTNGIIGLSSDDYLAIFNTPRRVSRRRPLRPHKSTIVVGPSGVWRRYTSNQAILGGSF